MVSANADSIATPTTIVMVEGDLGRRLVVRAAAGAPHREEVLHAAALAQQVLQAAAALRPGRWLVRTPLRKLRLDEEARLGGEARLEALDRGRVLLAQEMPHEGGVEQLGRGGAQGLELEERPRGAARRALHEQVRLRGEVLRGVVLQVARG